MTEADPEMKAQMPAAAVRNVLPISQVLSRLFAPLRKRNGFVLEIAAGSGYHAARFAAAFPEIVWQPSDADPSALESIAAHVAAAGLANLLPPIMLDVRQPWPVTKADAVICINMIHISAWPATVHLFKGAAGLLPPDGLLVTYGPYSVDGDFLAESNVAFDLSLKARNPEWGIRDVSDLARLAADVGLIPMETVRMPANNLILVFGSKRGRRPDS